MKSYFWLSALFMVTFGVTGIVAAIRIGEPKAYFGFGAPGAASLALVGYVLVRWLKAGRESRS